MKATKIGMAEYTIEELENYILTTQEKFDKAPKFIKRVSFSRWPSNKVAIWREIASRK
tara:strand:- start:301 stop:474 length:174 start_codon:yes stop_codon:yes gene_type:complete